MYKYHSDPGQRNQGKNNPRRKTSDLAKRTFAALAPFVNIEQCGRWYPGRFREPGHPIYMVTQEQWELYARLRDGEQPRYPDGRPFRIWHVTSGILSPRLIQKMMDGEDKLYYTAGVFGYALAMVDEDAHEDWQDDVDDLHRDVCRLLGADNLFVVKSARGINSHLKIDFGGHTTLQLNDLLRRLQACLKKQTVHRRSVVEVKGKAGVDRSDYGTLAKLPCYGEWTEQRLAEFQAAPVKTFAWLKALVEDMEKRQAPKPTVKAKQKRGSCLGFSMPEDEFERLPELVRRYESIANYCYAMRGEVRRKDVALTRQDFAIGLAVAALCSVHKKDEGLPQKFVKRVWQTAKERGLVSRPFNDSRWATLWRTLADCGLLDVADETYWFDPSGQEKGRCMAWSLQSAYNLAEETEETGIATGAFSPPKYVPGVYRPTRVPAPGSPALPAWTTAPDDELVDAVMSGRWSGEEPREET
jgi:hypothetical protein